MSKQKPWLKAAGWTLALSLFALNCTPQAQSVHALPDSISFVAGQELSYKFFLPLKVQYEGEAAQVVSDKNETLGDVGVRGMTIMSGREGKSTITLSLFGIIPVKKMTVRVLDDKVLIPGGIAVGVTLHTKGVLVVGMSPVSLSNGEQVCPVRDAGIQAGDSILAVNGEMVADTNALVALISKRFTEGKKITLTVLRFDDEMFFEIKPVLDSAGNVKIGVWARDSTNGVGTLTYFDPSTKEFGALGHPITDADTGTLLSVKSGNIYAAEIVGAKTGTRGSPGELKGVFGTDGTPLGVISSNTLYGIFGQSDSLTGSSLYPQGLPVAGRSSVQVGKATIITTVDKNGPKEYDCEIVQLFKQDSISSKSMVIKITDEQLIEKTGGIVQGMSGSPILQNGCIVGAVTHVYVSDPTRGYGIYIEWMLNAAE